MSRLHKDDHTFALQVLASILLLIDCLLKQSFPLHELYALISSLIQVHQAVLGQQRHHLSQGLNIRTLSVPLQAFCELFALLDFAKFLNSIAVVLILATHCEDLGC